MSLHVPLTPETRHLIDKKALTRMKRSAYLINTSRGPVVDEEALAWALREHLLAGAALDVYEHEPAIHPDLLALENVLLVPHLGSATTETRTAMADLAVENVIAVLGGRPATHARMSREHFHPSARVSRVARAVKNVATIMRALALGDRRISSCRPSRRSPRAARRIRSRS